jgi:hypothetical protein
MEAALEARERAKKYFNDNEPEEIASSDVPKNGRCFSFEDQTRDPTRAHMVPRCYTENTSKEELVLEHVLEYNR